MSSSCTAIMLQAVVRRSSTNTTRRATTRRTITSISTRCFSDAARVVDEQQQEVVVPANGGLASWAQEEAKQKAAAKKPKLTTRELNPNNNTTTTAATTTTTLDTLILQQHQDDDLLSAVEDMDSLMTLASQACTPLRLLDMYRYASSDDPQQRLRNAQFLYKEIPIRVAQRAVDLLTLPHGLGETKPIQNVAKIYLEYLDQFQAIACPTSTKQEEAFTDFLQTMVLDRTAIPIEIARGVQEWTTNMSLNVEQQQANLQEMNYALIRFFTARVGLRFLCEHHIMTSPKRLQQLELNGLLHHPHKNNKLGLIETDCNVVQEIQHVSHQVTQQTKDCYGMSPEIQIVECSSRKSRNFTFVPHHLQYMVAELLKNASRATVQFHLKHLAKHKVPPPIRVIVARGDEDVTIKIADRGGGVPRSKMDYIWSFAHSTADKDEEAKTDFGTNAFTGASTHGFGLPLSKIYAKYFGGELTLKTMEGYGTDAYLYLPRLGDACENLPKRVTVSPGEGISNPSFLNKKKKKESVRSFSTSSATQQPQGL